MPSPQDSHKSRNTLYLVDISSFIFRAFFAIRSLKNKKGEPTNAVYGVATMLARLAEEAKPEYLAIVYDSKEPSFRKEIYPAYKANRSAPPDDLVPQFARVAQLIEAFEIHSYRQSGMEADDLIGTLTHRWCEAAADHEVVIVTSDKDLMQLVSPRVRIWDTMLGKFYLPAQVEEKFGVKPTQIRDYLAIVGDSSDNIPGVTGIGPKGAVELLKQYETLPAILQAAEKGLVPGKKGQLLVEHRKNALLSAELASVNCELPVEIPMESLAYHFHVTPQCVELLKELDFHTLVKKWQSPPGDVGAVVPTGGSGAQSNSGQASAAEWSESGASSDGKNVDEQAVYLRKQPQDHFKTILTVDDLTRVVQEMRRVGEFGLDLETTSLNPREARIVGIALCYDPSVAYYVPIGHKNPSNAQLSQESVFKILGPVLEDAKIRKVGQNLKFDFGVLKEQGLTPRGLSADTMVAAYLLDPDGRHNLKAIAAKYLDYEVLTYEEVCGKGKSEIRFDEVDVDVATRYSAEDAWIALKLWHVLRPLLVSEGVLKVYEQIDLPLVEVLSSMELQGVCIDPAWLNELSGQFAKDLAEIESRVQTYSKGPVNLNSPKQLAQLLFEELKLPTQGKTKTGFSTDASVLEALAPLHEVPRLLLEYREISKLKGTYVDPLPLLRDAKTSKLHPSFNQTIAATGRLSCTDPNLQNIPIRSERGMQIRKAFIPSPGNLLLSADYSQIELRLLAHMSGDTELVRAFLHGEDVHQQTASDLFEVNLDDVTDSQRAIAKAINFGLMYGKTAFGLAQEMQIPRKEAQDIINRYFTKYHAVKRFLDQQILDAHEKGYVCSLEGRKRWLADINSKNPMLRNNSERMAMNSPIQGTAADLIKLAMIQIHRELLERRFESRLTIQVHDEVVLDCPEREIEPVRSLVVSAMEGAMKLSVPLSVNVAVGKNWMEL